MRGLCMIVLASCVLMVTAKAWVLKIEAKDDGKDTLKLENPQESQSVALIRLPKKPGYTQIGKYTECYGWWCEIVCNFDGHSNGMCALGSCFCWW